MITGRAREFQPLLVGAPRLLRVHGDVAIGIAGFCLPHAHGLVPAMLPRDRIRVYREGEILVHPAVAPPDPERVRVIRCERFDTLPAAHDPDAPLPFEGDRRHGLALPLLAQLPAPHVVAARDNAGTDPLGDPGLDD